MIDFCLALLCTVQMSVAPEDRAGGALALDAAMASTVTGRVELTPAAARAAAIDAAVAGLRDELERRGSELAEAASPVWLPSFVTDSTLHRWLSSLELERGVEIVDGRIEDRDHGSYRSYQAHLRVRPDEGMVSKSLARLRRLVDDAGERFLGTCGATTLLWGVLAFAYLWMDRLTRGYMTWRLRGLFASIAIAVPAVAFLFV